MGKAPKRPLPPGRAATGRRVLDREGDYLVTGTCLGSPAVAAARPFSTRAP